MQNEKDYFYPRKISLQIHGFEIVLWKIVGTFLVFDVLDNNIFLNVVDVNKFLLLVYVFD